MDDGLDDKDAYSCEQCGFGNCEYVIEEGDAKCCECYGLPYYKKCMPCMYHEDETK